MMHGPETEGAAVLRDADGDPMKIEQLPGRLEHEITLPSLDLQELRTAFLARRGVDRRLAPLVAALAFSRGGARQ